MHKCKRKAKIKQNCRRPRPNPKSGFGPRSSFFLFHFPFFIGDSPDSRSRYSAAADFAPSNDNRREIAAALSRHREIKERDKATR